MRPEDLHPADRRRQRRRRDLAFTGYLYLGWMLAMAFLLHWIPVTVPGYWTVGSFLSFPALVLAVPAALLALAFTAIVGRERSLWLLAALVLAVWPVLWASSRLPRSADWLAGAFFAALTALLVALPIQWFLGRRSPWTQTLPGEPEHESKRHW